ncbi:hypothetical protein ACE1TH_11190 [Shouchella sp. JSM 1781072]|uniref:hypothetical protein n=1 Tax=Bacillaceae TaxID=186817 RepID=UPI0020D0883F|nr:hypothetical protein [Alkalihalobacillus sp. LMS6]UTR07094.1 hypothetical protein MM326_03410 [Alkalihalobacillus sp. LMS6]
MSMKQRKAVFQTLFILLSLAVSQVIFFIIDQSSVSLNHYASEATIFFFPNAWFNAHFTPYQTIEFNFLTAFFLLISVCFILYQLFVFLRERSQ